MVPIVHFTKPYLERCRQLSTQERLRWLEENRKMLRRGIPPEEIETQRPPEPGRPLDPGIMSRSRVGLFFGAPFGICEGEIISLAGLGPG